MTTKLAVVGLLFASVTSEAIVNWLAETLTDRA